MPFGLRLKRTRRYNVSNKNCFVIRIKLLDTSVIECTLSVESTGQECLEAAAQRLELRELAHFGLWYSNKQQQLRWVDLEKPLRKQLDKFAQEALLHFGVLFYVPSEIQLQQEVTRYQYYLQLKKDIIEGKLPCSVEQSVRLASLAVQADFGDYDQYQSQEFLRDYILFPMVWAQDDSLQEEMTVKVAIQHQNLRGLIAEQAELVYIREVEKLDGFGHESFPAKESTGTDLTIGAAFQGIFVKYKSEKAPALYKWSDITNVTHNKAFVGLELMNKEETVQFQTDDIEMAKYVWRMFSLKHKFFRLNKSLMEQTQNTSPTLIRRRSTLTRSSMQRQQPYIMPPMQMQYNEPYTETHMSSQDSIYPGQQDNFFYRSETSLDRYPLEYAGQQVSNGKVPNGSVYSAPSLNSLNNHSQGFLQQQQQQMQQQQQQPSPISSNLSIPGSEVLLMRPDYVPSHRHSAIIVPSYRPTPDYETVMRQFQRSAAYRMERHSQSLRSLNLGSAHAYAQPEGLVYSQPEIRADHHGQYPQQQQQQQQQQHHHYPLQMNYSHPMQPTYLGTGGHPCSYNTPAASAISHTVSTPELTQEAHPATAPPPPPPPPAALPPSGPPTQHLVPTLQQQQQQSYGNPAGRMLRGLLSSQSQRHPQQPPPMAASGPPPPYPRPRPAASTPDLVAHQRVCSSNPDLVSRRVLHSVQTFQEDSLPVVHRSLLEVSEPLTRFRGLRKRNSLGATPPVALTPGANGLAREVEALAISRRASGRPRPIVGTDTTVLKVLPPSASLDQPREMEEGLRPPAVVASPLQQQQQQQELELQRPQSYSHKKSPSDATVLIHSSESEGEGEVEIEERQDYVLPMPPRSPAVLTPQEYKSHLQAVLANIPKRPPPEYPGGQVAAPQRPSYAYGQDTSSFLIGTTSSHNSGLMAQQMGGMSPLVDCKGAAVGMGGASLGPSVSEPDLSSAGKERVRSETPRERPVSELFSLTDNIVEREFLLHKRGNTAEIKKMGPLKMAVMNGLSMSRIPLPEEVKEEPPKVPMDERCKMLQERLEQGMVFTEYERVLKKRAQADCSTATLSENHDRNRFKDVVPYEENRIELLPSKDNPTGYVNASRVQVTVSGEEWHYIATQGPLPCTCQDFWQMVWEEGVNVIAMVTQEEEGGKSKSHRYWPKLGSRHSSVTYGKFKVTTKFRTDFGCYATTGLKLKHLLDGHERTVWHLQYTDWPDHGCPDHVQGFLGYLEEIKSVRRHTNNMLEASKPANPPVVVHCSAGVGRTGVVILTEMMIACLEHNEKLDVPDVLAILRTQRMLMVQTITQYTFVYQALIQFLRSSRLI